MNDSKVKFRRYDLRLSLSKKEFLVIQELQKNPLISYTELAKRLRTDLKNIRRIIKKLSSFDEEGSQEEDRQKRQGKRTPLNFYAVFDYTMLGLRAVNFLVECKNEEEMRVAEYFCDVHPYTFFRTRIFGGSFRGLFVKYHVPPTGFAFIEEAYQRLQSEGLISNYRVIINNDVIAQETVPDISAYDPIDQEWNFSLEEFDNHLKWIRARDTPFLMSGKPRSLSHLGRLDIFDIMILREWSYGAGPRKSNNEVLSNILSDELRIYHDYSKCDGLCENLSCRGLDVDRYLVAKRKNKLQELDLITGYGIGFDRKKVSLFNRYLFIGKTDKIFLQKLSVSLEKGYFPFTSVLGIDEPAGDDSLITFYWWVESPPRQSNDFVTWLFERTVEVQVYVVSNEFDHSSRYELYHENFVAHAVDPTNPWRVDEQYCLTTPINEILRVAKQKGIKGEEKVEGN